MLSLFDPITLIVFYLFVFFFFIIKKHDPLRLALYLFSNYLFSIKNKQTNTKNNNKKYL